MRSIRRLGTAVVVLLGVQIVLLLTSIGLIFHELSLVSRLASEAEWEEAITRSDAIGALNLLAFLVTAVVWLIWQHRAHANLHAVFHTGFRFTPGWGVGWWFVPIANLWKPFQAVRELWTESDALGQPAERSSSIVVVWWWCLWILGNVLGGVAGAMFEDSMDLPDFRRAEFIEIASDALTIGAAVLAITIVRSIAARQEAFRAHPPAALSGGAFLPPLPGTSPPRPDTW